MARRKIRISTDGSGRGAVEIEGQPIPGVCGYTLTQDVQGNSNLTLDIVMGTADIDTQADVTLPEKTRAALIALGWTPPPTTGIVDASRRPGELTDPRPTVVAMGGVELKHPIP